MPVSFEILTKVSTHILSTAIKISNTVMSRMSHVHDFSLSSWYKNAGRSTVYSRENLTPDLDSTTKSHGKLTVRRPVGERILDSVVTSPPRFESSPCCRLTLRKEAVSLGLRKVEIVIFSCFAINEVT